MRAFKTRFKSHSTWDSRLSPRQKAWVTRSSSKTDTLISIETWVIPTRTTWRSQSSTARWVREQRGCRRSRCRDWDGWGVPWLCPRCGHLPGDSSASHPPEPHDIFTLTGRSILLSLNFITIFPFALVIFESRVLFTFLFSSCAIRNSQRAIG